MGVTINGNSISITNANIEIINGANDESGVSYIIITPDGGVGQLPFMAQGLPGQPTLFPSIALEIHPAGETLPTENPTKTLVDAGGAGVSAKYNLVFHINAPADGEGGAFAFANATDLAASPARGAGTTGFTLLYRHSDQKFVLTAVKVGNLYVSSLIAATAFNNTSPRLLSSIPIGQSPYPTRLKAYASTIVTGSDGPEPTRVNLVARLDNAASGDQLGFARGLIGSNPQAIQTVLLPTFLHAQDVPGTYALVPANTTCTAHLRAEQSASSSSSWSTPASPDTVYAVEVMPL